MNREEHLLIILSEECSEVSKEVSKALRFGLSDMKPEQIFTNADMISKELGDLIGIAEMLYDEGIIERPSLSVIMTKKARVEKYLNYSKSVGKLKTE
jgi:hypothetical protein